MTYMPVPPRRLARAAVLVGTLLVLAATLPVQAATRVAGSDAPVPGAVTVCDGPAGPKLTCTVPQGPLVVATVIAVGTRPDKHPVQAGPGWTVRGRTLHLSIFSSMDPRHEVTFVTDINVREWRVEFTVVDGGAGGREFGYSAATACSRSHDPVCNYRPGTPGKLVAPPVSAGQTDLVLLACVAHDEAGMLAAPDGYDALSARVFPYVSWLWGADAGPAGQSVACHTQKPDYVHGIAARVVIPSR
jgi:hypothetical protein